MIIREDRVYVYYMLCFTVLMQWLKLLVNVSFSNVKQNHFFNQITSSQENKPYNGIFPVS